MHCDQCIEGSHHLCRSKEETIVRRHGGFAEYVRCHWSWAIALPDNIDTSKAGPLLCGGITVFNPILMANVSPLDKVGVIGIGGLGHMAVKMLNKWGCEVTAFSSTASKTPEILDMLCKSGRALYLVVKSRSLEAQLEVLFNLERCWNSVHDMISILPLKSSQHRRLMRLLSIWNLGRRGIGWW